MPTYSDPENGVSLSEALRDAAHSKTLRPFRHAFELWHPIGTPTGAIYCVADNVKMLATKPATSTRDAGLEVEWLAAPIKHTVPDESDKAAAPEITLSVSNVQGIMSDALRRALGSLEPWEIVAYVYALDDTSAPAVMPPTSLYVTSVDIDGEVVTLHCSYGDPANVSVPAATFQRRYYPGLVR